MSVEETELLPCPFCGSESIVVSHLTVTPIPGYTKVRCNRCYVRTGDHKSKEAAMAAWNTRTHYGEGEQPLNLREVTAAEAHVHVCGDPNCIVPHPAPHKRPPKARPVEQPEEEGK